MPLYKKAKIKTIEVMLMRLAELLRRNKKEISPALKYCKNESNLRQTQWLN